MEDFKWTDSLVKEFQIFYNKIPYAITGIDPIKKGIEMFKESKEKKEYEVLSFKHKNERYNLTNDGNYGRINFFNPASLNHVPENAEILSVKRLYDGAIFSVGEKVYLKASDGKGVFYIRKFTIKDGQCFASSGINIMQLDKSSTQPIESKEQEGYEILSLKYEKDKKVYPFTYLPNGVYIYSVKRLSDGEVFRVGDLVKWNLERNDQTPFLIESFEENHMHPSEKRMFCNNKNIDICYLEKVPQQTTKGESPIAFERELQILINNHSKENDSNTPDYILANFLSNCLKAFNGAVILKEVHLGL